MARQTAEQKRQAEKLALETANAEKVKTLKDGIALATMYRDVNAQVIDALTAILDSGEYANLSESDVDALTAKFYSTFKKRYGKVSGEKSGIDALIAKYS